MKKKTFRYNNREDYVRLTPFTPGVLSNEDTYDLCVATLDVCKPHFKIFPPAIRVAMTMLTTKTMELSAEFNRNRVRVLTEIIEAEDKLAAKIWRRYRRELKTIVKKSDDAEQVAMARELLETTEPYITLDKMAHTSQMRSLNELESVYQSPELQAKIAALGFEDKMSKIFQSNRRMQEAWDERSGYIVNRHREKSATELRLEATKLYVSLMDMMQYQNEFAGSELLDEIISDINVIRDKYAEQIADAKAARQRKKAISNEE